MSGSHKNCIVNMWCWKAQSMTGLNFIPQYTDNVILRARYADISIKWAIYTTYCYWADDRYECTNLAGVRKLDVENGTIANICGKKMVTVRVSIRDLREKTNVFPHPPLNCGKFPSPALTLSQLFPHPHSSRTIIFLSHTHASQTNTVYFPAISGKFF